MEIIILSVKNPIWVNAENTAIDCEITTSHFGDEVLAFTASPNDVEAHGRAIFDKIVTGVYGNIAKYIPPPIVPQNTATPSSGDIPSSVL